MFSTEARYDSYQGLLNECRTKKEAERVIKGFSTWLFNYRHIAEVADRTPWFKTRMRMDKAAWKIK
jgi:hypothetical protein